MAYLIEERELRRLHSGRYVHQQGGRGDGEAGRALAGARFPCQPLLCTFHSFCVRVLRRDIEAVRVGGEGLTRDFAIYDESDQQSVVKQAMRRLGLDDKQLTPRVVLSRISWAKNHMLDPQEAYLQ